MSGVFSCRKYNISLLHNVMTYEAFAHTAQIIWSASCLSHHNLCHWHIIQLCRIVGLGIKQKSINIYDILEVSIGPFVSKASYCIKGIPYKGKSELCSNASHDRNIFVYWEKSACN